MVLLLWIIVGLSGVAMLVGNLLFRDERSGAIFQSAGFLIFEIFLVWAVLKSTDYTIYTIRFFTFSAGILLFVIGRQIKRKNK